MSFLIRFPTFENTLAANEIPPAVSNLCDGCLRWMKVGCNCIYALGWADKVTVIDKKIAEALHVPAPPEREKNQHSGAASKSKQICIFCFLICPVSST